MALRAWESDRSLGRVCSIRSLGAVALTLAFAAGSSGCSSQPAHLDGEVRYRAQKPQVLVVRSVAPEVTANTSTGAHRARHGPPSTPAAVGPHDPSIDLVPANVLPEALARLVDDLDGVGFFDLPATASRPGHFPALTIDVDVRSPDGDGEARRHTVSLAGLSTPAEADVFARAAGLVVAASRHR